MPNSLKEIQNTESSSLSLDNQICFSAYALSNTIQRAYQPMLKSLGLTYPQYLVMICLWESPTLSMQALGQKLLLDSGTLTPMCKKLEDMKLIARAKKSGDARCLEIHLSVKGKKLKLKAEKVPKEMFCLLRTSIEKLSILKKELDSLRIALSGCCRKRSCDKHDTQEPT